jgi:homoserine kinase type II
MQGLAYAYASEKIKMPGHYIPEKQRNPYNKNLLSSAMLAWGRHLDQIRPNIFIQGSPERSDFRTVATDTKGHVYVLETINPCDYDKRMSIASRLHILYKNGLPVIPYMPGLNGAPIQKVSKHYWQLSDFIEGVNLDRASYWQEGWRGRALADFLADLYLNTQDDHWHKGPEFSLPSHIDRLINVIQQNNPQILKEITGIVELLKKELYPVYDSIPQRFCHGDPHPMNVLWDKDSIKAVIDWEFSGLRPVLYDTALVIGCVASEASGALDSAFIKNFCRRIREREIFAPEIYDLLPLFIVAQRFAWLSEWLRRNDVEMIEFECYFMNLLFNKNLKQYC